MADSFTNTDINSPSFSLRAYTPLLVIIIVLICMSFALGRTFHTSMTYFMGLFFCIFAMFKFFDLKNFVLAFGKYDFITKNYPFYGYIYPFIEFGLGLSYLAQSNNGLIDIVTFILMGVSITGVIQSIRQGQKINCACLGNLMNVPLGIITILENGVMGLMAFYMILENLSLI